MESTERDLLTAIVQEPEDQFLYQVYADWLEEEGFVSRSNFIRVSTKAESIPQGLVAEVLNDQPVTREIGDWKAISPREAIVDGKLQFYCLCRWGLPTALYLPWEVGGALIMPLVRTYPIQVVRRYLRSTDYAQ